MQLPPRDGNEKPGSWPLPNDPANRLRRMSQCENGERGANARGGSRNRYGRWAGDEVLW